MAILPLSSQTASAPSTFFSARKSRLSLLDESGGPTGASDKFRHKMMRRIVSEGLLMSISLCICIALVSEMYTTTALQAEEQPKWQLGRRRVRLSYNNSPIADFGIAQGSVRVTAGDRLAYWNIHNNEFLMGQDPTDHYRIYIKTLAGDEYYLDFGMFTFNLCFMVDVEPYCRFGLPDLKMVPAHFHGEEYDKTGIDALLFKPRKRFSVLRDPRIHQLMPSTDVEYCECHDQPNIFSVMDEIAGRKSTDWETYAMMTFSPNAVRLMRLDMQNREYVNFPKVPKVVIDVDPDEEGITDDKDGEGEEMVKYMTKWTRKLRKGKITQERWEADFQKWANKPHEARMRRVNSK